MGKIRVDNDVLNSQQALLRELSRKMEEVSYRVVAANSSLSWEISASGRIKKRLNEASSYLDQLSRKTLALAGTLEGAAEHYHATEWKNAGHKWWEWKDTWNLAKEAGLVGLTLGTIGSYLTGGKSQFEDPIKGGLGVAKDIAKLVGSVAKIVPKAGESFDWKTLFGIQAGITDKTPTNFFEAIGEGLGKYDMGNATAVSDKIAVGAKWAGSLLTVATSAYENFTDESNETFGRKIAETVGESVVKIGEGVLVSAAVTAGLAAVGAVGAPAVVVGGITVGVTWAIDKGFEYFTGKNTAEFISDTIIDGSINFVKDVGETIGGAVSSVGKTISGWWDSLGGVFSPA